MDIPALVLFRLAYNQLAVAVSEAVGDVVPEQKPAYGNVMEQLDFQDGMRLTDLAQGAGMAPQSIGELVDQLEELGMVERRPDPDDRRAKRVYLTALAVEAQQAARNAVAESEARMAKLMGNERLGQLKADLAKVIQEFGGSLPEAPTGN
jgi:DNA-binding MarR family transcriptional regulator